MSDSIGYDEHANGAARLAEIIGLIPADHPQLWKRADLITRAAETIRERYSVAWEIACTIAEHEYDPTVPGMTLAQHLRYRRRRWAAEHLSGVVVTPETRVTPLPDHGPRELLPADRRDCGCGWGDLCDAQPHGICACTPYRNITRQDWRRIVDTTC